MDSKALKIKACMITQFFEYYDVQDIDIIIRRVKNLTNIKDYAVVIHDRDVLDNGEPKKKHFHAVLTFSNATTIWAVAKWLGVQPQYVEKIKNTVKSARLYLVHRNDTEKFQYSPEDVKANFDYVEYVDGCKPKIQRESIAERIANWEIKEYNLYSFITADEYARNSRYYNNAFRYRMEKMANTERKLECLFITWASGTWKTTFAKQLATSKGYEVYVSSGGRNPLDNYAGQECIILDDLRDNVYPFQDLLKLTDNNTDSLAWCRFYNKSIKECKLLIITSIQEIYDFYNTQTDEKEPQYQLFRRIKTYAKMDREKVIFYEYNEPSKLYKKTYEVINPVSILFDKEVHHEFVSWIISAMQLKEYKEDDKTKKKK